MSNYQTDFLNALSITSNSLSGLMRDIREPDFQERVKIEEQSQMRLNQQIQDFKMEELEDRQAFRLTEMDKATEESLEQYKGQTIVNFEDAKDRDEYFNLNPDRAEQMQKIQQAVQERDTDWLKDNYKENMKLQRDIQIYAQKQGKKVNEQGWINYLTFGLAGYEGADRIQADRSDYFYDKSTNQMVRRGDALFEQRRNQEEVLKAIYQASGVSPQFQEEHSSTQQGFNALYGGLNTEDPASMLAARSLLNMQNDGLYAQMVVDNQKGFAMRNVLESGTTPEFDINKIVGNVSKNTKRDRFFGRSPEQRMELATATKNAYSSSLGLATMQAQYALQDKFGGINRSRQKEALKDLVEAKTLAERLMKDTKFGRTSKENIENYKQYYGDSIKMLNTWIQALQR
jgi:hypothetical protein